jgi:hypothetical protein
MALASDYVLPYPSYMPGHTLYKARQLLETVQEYWYFGDMAKVKYHLKMSDKYLVEAKILFEYDQIKLGVKSLAKTNEHFIKAVLYERDVIFDKKDTGGQKQVLQNAGKEHLEILKSLETTLPEKVTWHEEKKEPEEIALSFLLSEASIIRGYADR